MECKTAADPVQVGSGQSVVRTIADQGRQESSVGLHLVERPDDQAERRRLAKRLLRPTVDQAST